MPVSSLPSREFIFIRHGESESNADLATEHPKTINLTPKGIQQARDRAAAWIDVPDIFVTSKYVRTRQTAAPFMDKFPAVPVEEWDIHEFTFLDPQKYKGTTFTERQPHSKAYWEKADPFHKDSAFAESFAEFMQRCLNTLARMQQSPHARVVAFCHGFFIKGLMLAIDGHFTQTNSTTMQTFQELHKTVRVDNCDVVRFVIEGDRIRYHYDNAVAATSPSPLRTD